MSIESLARPEILAMKPYSSARREAPAHGVLLNANESPESLLQETGLASGLNRYPEPQPAELLRRLAALYAVPEEQLLVTRGSDEGIDLLTRVFCRAGQDAVMYCPPTFGMYRIAAQAQGAGIVTVPRSPENAFRMDEAAVLAGLEANPAVRLVFLTSPNNPTGDLVTGGFLRDLLDATQGRALVVLDEAYVEFCSSDSAAPLVASNENLVVLRTLSKAWASAGLRCGTVIAQPSIISLLQRVIAPYPLAGPVISLALRVLQPDMMERQGELLAELKRNKSRLLEILASRPFVRQVLPGEANFVLVRAERAKDLLAHCARRGVVLRGFPAEAELRDWLRITVGSSDEISALASALDTWEGAS
ncbi:MAG: histidinol-phosphate transaminase [Lysobacterales bacterium]|jgi:histidinol-phosphate aminotransferase